MTQPLFETIATHSHEVICDGGKGSLGHPRVYLHIEEDTGQITCPYCSRTYIFEEYGSHASH